jgi:cell surface protein SprA
LNLKTAHILRTLVGIAMITAFMPAANSQQSGDTSLRFPLTDRRGDFYTNPNRNTFDFRDTSWLKKNIVYDPITKQYFIEEKVGDQWYRTPVVMTFEEYLRFKARQDEEEYFKKRAAMLSSLNRRLARPKFKVSNDWFNRLMGVGPDGKVKVDIKPSGSIDILAGYQRQNIKNPTLPERARVNGGFDFNMNSQLQVDASIGQKLKLPINYNTLANFDFENQLKFDYVGSPDEILKQFQAGTVNFTTKSTLMPSLQSLFGIKTTVQFGKLYITGVLANQRSQRQSVGLQGGSASQYFNIRADEYDENRHFLLAQYFRQHYNEAMKKLPIVSSLIQVQRIEVWVTNKNNSTTTDVRDVVALADLGEGALSGQPNALPHNYVNNLYNSIQNNPATRNSSTVTSVLTGGGFNLLPVQDFEKTFARKLQPTDYYFNPTIGFVSLNQPLQPDEVLGVAFQYTYNGKLYQVGEFSQDIIPDTTGTTQKVLFLKLLKATSQRTNLPIWDLMMKNVYSVGYGQLERQDFELNVTYEEPSFGEKRYLPPNDVINAEKGRPLLQQLNLDRLNNQNDPQPDGKFDFIEGYTVISSQSRIIFPVLEPFGHDLDYVYPDQATRDRFLFYPLYDTIKAIAQTFANLNRFELNGRSKSTSTGDYQLGYNIPRGSVTVTANGQILQENVDYEINYDLGTLRVTNPAILASGVPVNIQFENQAAFGLQQKNFMGLRFDYIANKNLTIGATIMQLGERPFFIKTSYGEDPIRNRMYGVDIDYRKDLPRLTKLLDKLPFYSTKTMSNMTLYAEGALLQPGYAKQIGKGDNTQSYIDDFEGTRSSIDLRFPLISWTLASVPQGNGLFPESALNNDSISGFNRAKIAWYNIEPVLQERRNANNPIRNLPNFLDEISKPETRQVLQQEIFPKKSLDFGQGLLTTFDIAYYPKDKGPYNFDVNPRPPYSAGVDANDNLLNPKSRWGGLMRNIDQTDFETGNIEFIEFWMQDPFVTNNTNPTGGKLYFHLGNISEDVNKDGKRFYENGLPTPTIPSPVDSSTTWGKVPSIPIQVTNAFSNNTEDRQFQDVGFDGLRDDEEKRRFAQYINDLQASFGTGSLVYQRSAADPSRDNFKPYRDVSYDGQGILERYKNINNPHGNSPVASTGDDFVSAFTQYPDVEDLNRDNTLNEAEEYFEYEVDIQKNMLIGTNFITDKRTVNIDLASGGTPRPETWYLFRIPVSAFTNKVGNIPDFKSIRFIRMFATDFENSLVMRFGKLELVRNQWRKFKYEINQTGQYVQLPTNDPVTVNTLAVNLEENDTRTPIPYKIPPGIERQQQLSNNNVQLFLNEQSLSVQLKNLPPGEARGVFKTMNLDMTQYGKLKMFVHAEGIQTCGTGIIQDDQLTAVVRIGSDFVSNYYEVRIPLKRTEYDDTTELAIWPELNNLDFALKDLTDLKMRRNRAGGAPSVYYSEPAANGRQYAILGNPNLGEVRGMLLSVENTSLESACGEVWFNELRFSNLNDEGGAAARALLTINGGDLFNFNAALTATTPGFGTLEQRVNERSRESLVTIDLSATMDAGKLTPKKLGLQIPIYAGFSRVTSRPKYDPYDLDLLLKEKLNEETDPKKKDSIRSNAETMTTIRTFNITNLRKLKTDGKRPKIWSLSNLDFNYSVIESQHHSPLVESELMRRTRAAVGYNYAPQPRFIEPFKKLIKSKSKWFTLIKDFNINYAPSQLSFKADIFRQFGRFQAKNVDGGPYKSPETYDKYFTFDRYYILQWNLTRSISIDFSATNYGRVDEPFGRIDTKEKKDSVRKNLFKGGRNTQYQQDVTVTYNVPTQKFPLLDWTTLRASYNTKYNWLAQSLLGRSLSPPIDLGNTLTNTQTRTINGELKFEELYNKWKFLRAVYNTQPKAPASPDDKKKDSATGKKPKRIKDPNALPNVGAVPRFFAKLLTSVKRVGIQYTEDMGTTLPGYMDSTRILGYNPKSRQPGFDFILGYQPDTNWINSFAARGLLSSDTLMNSLIQQRYNQRLNITAQVSPFRDFTIDINLDKTFDKNYSELYKDTSKFDNVGFTRLNPYAAGSFSVSYISYQTLFTKFNPNVISETFKEFESNRVLLSKRLKELNPYAGSNPLDPDGYYRGYGAYAQDVVIPAFLAAYTGKDPSKVKLIKNSNPTLRSNPFSGILPKPNWTVTYNGLSRLKGLDKIFTNVTIRHGYHSTLSMNSFNHAFLFEDINRIGFPSFIDTARNGTRAYVPYFLVPNITIAESFDPLIEVDMTFTNQMSVRFEWRKSRQLSLSLVDYQLAENRTTEFTFGFNWRKKGVPLIRKLFGKPLDNDVTFKMDFSLRDDATANSKLDQGTSFGTAGQKVIRIAPSIDYILNSRVSLKFYFEQNRNIPKISNAFPITNTRAGLQVRVSLNQ